MPSNVALLCSTSRLLQDLCGPKSNDVGIQKLRNYHTNARIKSYSSDDSVRPVGIICNLYRSSVASATIGVDRWELAGLVSAVEHLPKMCSDQVDFFVSKELRQDYKAILL